MPEILRKRNFRQRHRRQPDEASTYTLPTSILYGQSVLPYIHGASHSTLAADIHALLTHTDISPHNFLENPNTSFSSHIYISCNSSYHARYRWLRVYFEPLDIKLWRIPHKIRYTSCSYGGFFLCSLLSNNTTYASIMTIYAMCVVCEMLIWYKKVYWL